MVSTARRDRSATRVPAPDSFPVEFGFRGGLSGAHASRTMMLADFFGLLDAAPQDATRDVYVQLIVDENVLGKRTASNRTLTSRHLVNLYGLDPSVTIFRLLTAAYGERWNASKLDELLSAVDYAGSNLEDWLRNGFFEQHCKLFHRRPFIWRICPRQRPPSHP